MYILVYIESTLTQRSEKVVHVCGFVCVCLLSVIFIIKIMHLSYNNWGCIWANDFSFKVCVF